MEMRRGHGDEKGRALPSSPTAGLDIAADAFRLHPKLSPTFILENRSWITSGCTGLGW